MFEVIDDFLPADIFTMLRNHCDKIPYAGITNPVDGVVYPDISIDIPNVVKQFFGQPKTLFMRLSLAGVKAPHQAHTDTSMGQQSLMLYLTRAQHCKGGTSLVEHKETGMRSDPRDEEELNIWRRDTNNPKAWKVYEQADMVPNRVALFPANLMHRAEPVGGFGTNAENGRLVLTAFY
jgi:hypothetical protein